ALGILLLEQDGKLSREDSVKDYISWFQPTYDGKEVTITIEHLLCHTSGIPVWTIAGLPTGTVNDEGLLENTVKGIQSVKLDSMPGTVHNYATINYDVLALIIEKVSGMPYEEYIGKNVLEPLGMSNSYFRVDNEKVEQSAQGYRYAFLGVRKYDAPTFYGNTAAGYLVSDTEDLSIWMKAQMGMLEADMTEKIERAIAESHLYPIEKGQHYFAGWNLYDTYFRHGGNNPNFSSQVIIGRTNKKAVFALANICGSAPTKAADGIYRMMQGETVEIGFWIDGYSLIDLLCVIICLTEIYIMVLLFEKRGKKKYAGIKISFCLLMAVIVPAIPYILHYNYFNMAVWCSPCLLVAVAGIEICFAEYVVLCAYNRKK
ncbi:MAG: beta-lactamase family protein, partial [Lachnospiraceae bacterium]|nr:beta-lactamase family protein [Lachnospiraceae bacterium]